MRIALALFVQELHRPRRRPRHGRPDPLAFVATRPSPGTTAWYPVGIERAAHKERRLATAKRNREASIEAWFHGRMSPEGLRQCELSYRETVREVTR